LRGGIHDGRDFRLPIARKGMNSPQRHEDRRGELEALILRLRSALAPSLNATEEIATVLRDILAGM
jgi:hypothetical protein